MRPSLRRTGAFLALLALLLGVPQGVLVMCAGEDGHLAVEFTGGVAERPALPPDGDESSVAGPCTCGDGCGPCQDSPVGPESLAGRLTNPRERTAPPRAAASVLSTAVRVAAAARSSILPPHGAPPGSSRPSLRGTVVLLI